MRLYAIFLILNIHLGLIFASPPLTHGVLTPVNHNLRGFECGNYFFTDDEVSQVLWLAAASFDKGLRYPQIYRDDLHSESYFNEYFLYPLRKGLPIKPESKDSRIYFFVIFTKNSEKVEVVDVVAKITIEEYTKCIRRGSLHIGPSNSLTEIPNGYLCGRRFLNDELVQKSLAKAMDRDNTKYTRPYIGLLRPEYIGSLLWPVIKLRPSLYESSKARGGPYYMILSSERQLLDVVVKGHNGNYLRCIRSRDPKKAPASDQFSKLFVPPPKTGYFCGKLFFDDKNLERILEIIVGKVKSRAGVGTITIPLQEHSGPPFNQACLLWPLLVNGNFYKKGTKGPYRFVITPDYKILGVAMVSKSKIIPCERATVSANKNHDTSDYNCNQHTFSHWELAKAAEDACTTMNSVTRNFYPAEYNGPGFNSPGPYFTYPVLRGGIFGHGNHHCGLYRVVINRNCEVVGALTTIITKVTENNVIKVSKRMMRCHRLEDGPLPAGFFNSESENIYENRII